MNNKWKRSLALLLMLALIFTLPMATAWADGEGEGGGSNPPAAAPTGDPTAAGSYTLTLQPGSSAMIDGEGEEPGDAGMKDFVYDLYLVAEGVKDSSFDTYNYTVVSAFSSVGTLPVIADPRTAPEGSVQPDAAAAWAEAAQKALAVVKADTAGSLTKIAGDFKTSTAIATPGIYLVVTYSTDLAAGRQYFDGDNTIANTEQFVYTYAPQLIAVPGPKMEGENPIPSTANGWEDNVVGTLKPSRAPRYGDLVIVKNTTASASTTFGYHVVATLRNATVYDNYVGIVFENQTSKTYTISDAIPVGAEVTVTEEYTGAGFTQDGDPVITGATNGKALVLVKSADGTALTFTFTNKPDGSLIIGTGVDNVYVYHEPQDQR